MANNKVTAAALDWALTHLDAQGDGDLFPRPFEIALIKQEWHTVRPELDVIDISQHRWHAMRRVLVPKDDLSFRRACQLDPIDAILFNAIIYEHGVQIEALRRPVAEATVFSYRFAPDSSGNMFASGNPWQSFWGSSSTKSTASTVANGPTAAVAVIDITDFYNQISHHSLENQLNEANLPGVFVKALINLLSMSSEGVSRGIPTGPHASNFLAEAVLIPLDNYLSLQGFSFCRFVDDLFIFCESREKAQTAIFEVADFLDKTQKLSLNKQKTEIIDPVAFSKRADAMMINHPINDEEKAILSVIGRHGGPYTRIRLSSLSPGDLRKLETAQIDAVLSAYLSQTHPDYIRLRWFLRRLAQTGIPSSVPLIVNNIDRLLPAIGDTAAYLVSAVDTFQGNWLQIGDGVLNALTQPVVLHNEYLQLVLLSLFARVDSLNHLERLVQMYNGLSPFAKREILLAAGNTRKSLPWLQILKTAFGQMDEWQRRAYLYAVRQLPKDERKFWIKNQKPSLSRLEKLVATDSDRQP
jgi:hypothetical protein